MDVKKGKAMDVEAGGLKGYAIDKDRHVEALETVWWFPGMNMR